MGVLQKAALALFLAGGATGGTAAHHTPEASAPSFMQPLTDIISSEAAGLSCEVDVYARVYDELEICDFLGPGNPQLKMGVENLTKPGEEVALFLLTGTNTDIDIDIFNISVHLDRDIERIAYTVDYPAGWTKHVEMPLTDAEFGIFEGELFVTKGLPNSIIVKNKDGNVIGERKVKESIDKLLAANPPPAASDPVPSE